MIKRHAVWIIFVSAALLLSACGRETEAPAFEPVSSENVLRFDSPYSFASLDPTDPLSGGGYYVFPLLYSFLCVPDTSGNLHPDAALSWDYDSGTFTWSIKLRSDIRFHDGRPLTAKDVKYSIQLEKKMRPTLINKIRSIRAFDDRIEIGLTNDESTFLRKIWDVELIPEPTRDGGDRHSRPIGSGPYRFEKRIGKNTVILAANEDYYDGRPSLDGIVFNYIPDKEKTWARLLSGETDMTVEMAPQDFEMIQQYQDAFYFETAVSDWYAILLYNTNHSKFADWRVRQALAHAIDRDYIVNELLGGMAIVATGAISVDSPYHHPDLRPLAYDPETALELLSQAGWHYDEKNNTLRKNNEPFRFTMTIPMEYEVEKRIAQYIKICLNDIGIQMNIRPVPGEKAVACYYMNSAFDAVWTQFSVGSKRIEVIKSLWASGQNKDAQAGCFSNSQVSNLLKKADATDSAEIRKASMREVDKLLYQLQPGTFLFHKVYINVLSKRFELRYPFETTHYGLYFLRYARLRGASADS